MKQILILAFSSIAALLAVAGISDDFRTSEAYRKLSEFDRQKLDQVM